MEGLWTLRDKRICCAIRGCSISSAGQGYLSPDRRGVRVAFTRSSHSLREFGTWRGRGLPQGLSGWVEESRYRLCPEACHFHWKHIGLCPSGRGEGDRRFPGASRSRDRADPFRG